MNDNSTPGPEEEPQQRPGLQDFSTRPDADTMSASEAMSLTVF